MEVVPQTPLGTSENPTSSNYSLHSASMALLQQK